MGKASRKKADQTLDPSPQPSLPADSPGAGRTPLRGHFFVIGLLVSISIIIYSNTFQASFQFDDHSNIVENIKIRDLGNFTRFPGARDFGYLTFALNYHFGGLNVWGYHLVNLIIHSLNGILVYLLVILLFRLIKPTLISSDSTGTLLSSHLGIACVTALLFTVHPIQTQAVTYIVQRFTSLASLFYLSTVLFYLKWGGSPIQNRIRWIWYVLAFISTILAMKTKEISFTLPIMLLLVDQIFLSRDRKYRRILLLPFLLTLLVIPYSHPETLGEGESGFARQTTSIDRSVYFLTQVRVLLTYLRLSLIPINQNLDYHYPLFSSLLHPMVLSSFLFLLALLLLATLLSLRLIRIPILNGPYGQLFGFGLLWFFLTISVESSIIPISDVIFEHRLYLPSFGLFLAFTILCDRLALHFVPKPGDPGEFSRPLLRTVQGMIVIFAITALAILTYKRNAVWRNPVSLWSDVVSKSYEKARPHNALGFAYAELGKHEDAVEEYLIATQIQPNYTLAYNNLGIAYKELGRTEEAFEAYQKAIDLHPESAKPLYRAKPHYNRGIAYKDLGQLDKAEQEFKVALDLNPNFSEAYFNLALVYEEMGRREDAIAGYQKGLRLNPTDDRAHYRLGNLFSEGGRLMEAIREYEKSIQINFDNSPAHFRLGVAFEDIRELRKAEDHYKMAIQTDPESALAFNNLGGIYKRSGRLIESVIELEKAVALQPELALAHFNLGHSQLLLGDPRKAIDSLQAGLTIQKDAMAEYSLGAAYEQLGNNREALLAFERALGINPNMEQAVLAIDRLSNAHKQ